jgi:hypothetical protein
MIFSNLLLNAKQRTISWKQKAKVRRKDNRKLQSRTKELTISRDKWKVKFQKLQNEHEELKKNEEFLE